MLPHSPSPTCTSCLLPPLSFPSSTPASNLPPHVLLTSPMPLPSSFSPSSVPSPSTLPLCASSLPPVHPSSLKCPLDPPLPLSLHTLTLTSPFLSPQCLSLCRSSYSLITKFLSLAGSPSRFFRHPSLCLYYPLFLPNHPLSSHSLQNSYLSLVFPSPLPLHLVYLFILYPSPSSSPSRFTHTLPHKDK